jgi:hypothetical protein
MRSIIQCSSIVRLEAELERDEPIAVERMREKEEGASSSNAAGPRFSNLATILKLAEPNTDGMRHECQLPRSKISHRAAHLRETDCVAVNAAPIEPVSRNRIGRNLEIERADFGTAVARNWQSIQWLTARFSYRSRL